MYLQHQTHPANFTSRDISRSELQLSHWWNGPPFSGQEPSCWPKCDIPNDDLFPSVPENMLELPASVLTNDNTSLLTLNPNNFSSLRSMIKRGTIYLKFLTPL